MARSKDKSYIVKPRKGEVERWRDLEEFSKYQISSIGNIRNKSTLHVLKPHKDDYNASRVQMVNDEGKLISRSIHSLQSGIASHVRHRDGDKSNNRIENLEFRPRRGEGVSKEKTGKFTVRIQFIGYGKPLYFGSYLLRGSAERVAVCVHKKLSEGITMKDFLLWCNEQKFSRRNFNLEDFDPEDLALYSEF